MKYGLSDPQLSAIQAIFKQYPDIDEVILFGSRAMGNYKEASDIDLAIKGEKADTFLAAKLKDHFESETYLPFFFDVIAYNDITSEKLQQHIDDKGIFIFHNVAHDGWKYFTINDFFEVQDHNRQPLSKIDRAERQGNYPYYGASGIIDYIDDYLFNGEHLLISEDGENLKTRKTPIAFIVSGKFWVNNHAHILKAKSDVYNKLIAYYFSCLDINQYITGAVQPKLSQKALKRMQFFLPSSLSEQRAIAEVLCSLDDKIDLLRRQNKTLEALAETIFHHYFIENIQGGKREASLADIVIFNPLLKLDLEALSPYLEMKNVASNHSAPLGWCYRHYRSGMKFQNGDALLARISPCMENGKTCFVNFLKSNQIGWGSTEFIVMRMRPNYHPFIAYLIAKNTVFRKFVKNKMSGTSGRQRVDVKSLKKYTINIPEPRTIQHMNSIMDSIAPQLLRNHHHILCLEKMRDTLLPKLISGKVRVAYDKENQDNDHHRK